MLHKVHLKSLLQYTSNIPKYRERERERERERDLKPYWGTVAKLRFKC